MFASPSMAEYNAPSHDSSHSAELRLSTNFHLDFPKSDVPTLMLHEAEPGHHLQACYAMRNNNLPLFRRVKDDRQYHSVPSRFPLNAAYTEVSGHTFSITSCVLFRDVSVCCRAGACTQRLLVMSGVCSTRIHITGSKCRPPHILPTASP